MSLGFDRRSFLTASAAASAGYWITGSLRAAPSTSPNEQIQFGCIGIGGMGRGDSNGANKLGRVVAICDVDSKRLKDAHQKRFPEAQTFVRFRELIDAMGDKIDAVTVSTPDHTHAVAAAAAMRASKHCYCQKPLTHSIWEARQLATIAKESGVATQMGNQGTANHGLRKAAALVKSGAIGKVSEVHAWTNRCGGWWKQGVPRPAPAKPPAHLAWEEWLGTAPKRPYAGGYHPFSWRGWWDFGTGSLGDMACHVMNLAFHALDLRDPIAVQATTSGHNRDSYPAWSMIDFEFPERNGRAPLTLHWYDGGKRPDKALVGGKELPGNGSIIVGEKATLYSPDSYGNRYELIGEIEEPDVEYERSPGHYEEWAEAIRGVKPAKSEFVDAAVPLTETVLLGNLAVWAADQSDGPGKRVEWDAKALKPTNALELEKIVRPELRGGRVL